MLLPDFLREGMLRLLRHDALLRRQQNPQEAERFLEELDELEYDEEVLEELNELEDDEEFFEKLDELEYDEEFFEELDDLEDDEELFEHMLMDRLLKERDENSLPPLPEKLVDWIDNATQQMRWKRARHYAAKELSAHLADQYDAFVADGMEEADAANATLREMGDAVETGTRLDSAWRPQPDWLTLAMVLLLATAGMVLQYVLRFGDYGFYPFSLLLQIIQYAVGVAILLIAYFLDYTLLGRRIRLLFLLWIVIGIWQALFPSVLRNGVNYELRQWVWWFPFLFAGILYSQRNRGIKGIGLCILSIVPLCFFCLKAFNMGAMCVLTGVSGLLLISAAVWGAFGKRSVGKLLLAASPILTDIVLSVWTLAVDSWLRERLYFTFLNPAADPQGWGYQSLMIRHLMFDTPLDQALAQEAMPYAFDNFSDYLLVCIKVRWGWLGFTLVLAALAALLLRVFFLAWRQSGFLAKCVTYTAVVVLTTQTVLYILQNLGMFLFTSRGLPLLSYRGTYFCQTMALLGLLLSTRRMGRVESGMRPADAVSRAMN